MKENYKNYLLIGVYGIIIYFFGLFSGFVVSTSQINKMINQAFPVKKEQQPDIVYVDTTNMNTLKDVVMPEVYPKEYIEKFYSGIIKIKGSFDPSVELRKWHYFYPCGTIHKIIKLNNNVADSFIIDPKRSYDFDGKGFYEGKYIEFDRKGNIIKFDWYIDGYKSTKEDYMLYLKTKKALGIKDN